MKPEDFQRAEDVLRRYEESLEKGFRGGVLGTMELDFPFRSVRACESRKDPGSRQESERQLRPPHPPTPGRYPRPVETHHRRGTISEGVHHGPPQAALVNRRGGY